MKNIVFETADAQYVMGIAAKTFSTGSRGFYAGGKIEIDGKRYQVSCSVVEVGSKPSKE